MYAPVNGGGARAPDNDDRTRITINVCLSADGTVQPASFIMKCATNAADQSKTTVVKSLLADPSFNIDGQWSMHWWQRTMQVKVKGKKGVYGATKPVFFKRPYLKHPDGRVVWSQVKAYMDTPGMAMYADLVLGPAVRASGSSKAILVMDKCRCHEVKSAVKFSLSGGSRSFTCQRT